MIRRGTIRRNVNTVHRNVNPPIHSDNNDGTYNADDYKHPIHDALKPETKKEILNTWVRPIKRREKNPERKKEASSAAKSETKGGTV